MSSPSDRPNTVKQDQVAKPRATKRLRVDRPERLIDDIAEDEDDPDADDDDFDPDEREEEEDASGFIAKEGDEEVDAKEDDQEDDAGPPRRAAQRDMSHFSLDQQKEQDEAERLQRDLEARYGGADEEIAMDQLGEGDEEDEERDLDGSSSDSMFPTQKDPSVWLIRCDPGKEDLMVLELMKRFIEQEASEQPSFIKSAYTTPASKGYIYVEADKEVHVKRAIRGLRPIKWWKMQLLELKDMVSTVKFKEEAQEIERGQWVRFKNGVYRGDLGKVVALHDQNTVVTVKLVPRIDVSEEGVRNNKRKRLASAALRPAPALFDRDDFVAKGGQVKSQRHSRDGRQYHVIGSNYYRHGFLYKETRLSGLLTENIQPSASEEEIFSRRLKDDSNDDESEDENKEEDAARAAARAARHEAKQRAGDVRTLSLQDHVIVTEGDMKNLTGRILQIDAQLVRLKPDPRFPEPAFVEIEASKLKKFFALGDHVKVIAGVYKDETGMVTQVQWASDTLCVYSDTQNRELTVRAAHAIESSEVSIGRETLGAYALGDLVQLAGVEQTVGVIVKIDVASFRVLTQRGSVETVKLQEIAAKRWGKFAAALDAAGNQLARDDVVAVQHGEHAKKQGTIRHIFRHFLFLFSRSVPENGGIFLVQARQVTLVGHKAFAAAAAAEKRAPLVPASPQIGFGTSDRDQGRASAAPLRAQRVGDRHPLLGKTVTIIGGPYKSFMGLVKEASEMSVTVELHALARRVIVTAAQVAERAAFRVDERQRQAALDGSRSVRSDFLGGTTPLLGSRTPADASQTPHMDAFAGSQTPANSSSDRDGWAAVTPAHQRDADDNEDGDEEDSNADEWSRDHSAQRQTRESAKGSNEELEAANEEHNEQLSAMEVELEAEEEKKHVAEAFEPEAPKFPPGCVLHFVDDAGSNLVGTMLRHNTDGSAVLRVLQDNNQQVEIPVSRTAISRLRPVEPKAKDRVLVLKEGNCLHAIGTLTSITSASQEAIVQLEAAFEILSLPDLCRYDERFSL